MDTLSVTPSLRKYPQRSRNKRVKYWYDEPELSMEETPEANRNSKKTDDSDEDSSRGKENNEDINLVDEEVEEEGDKEEISEYEKLRLKNLEENKRIMMELGLINPMKQQKVNEKKTKPKTKRKPAPKQIAEPKKRSLRLLNKTPEGKNLPLVFEETPETPEIKEKTRIEEESLPMNEDETITDFLDSLKVSLSQGTSSQTSMDSTDSLIQDMRNLELAKLEKVTKARVQSMCVHPMENNLLIVVGSQNGELGLWDVNNDQVGQFHPHLRPVNCVSISQNDPCELFTTSFDGTVRRADIQKSVFELVYQTDEKRNMCHVTWHTQIDANTLIVAHGTGEAGLVDLRTKCVEQWYHCHPRSMRTIHLHPTQPRHFLTSSGTGEAKVWDLRVSKKHVDEPVSTLSEAKTARGLTSAFFSPDGNKVVTTCNDDRIRIYDTSNLLQPKELHSILHDNHTGRWLSVFKTVWHTHSSDLLFVGSMLQPRRIQMYNGSGRLVKDLMDEELSTVTPVISQHPTLPIIVGGNSSGKAHVFTTPQYISQYFN